MHAYTWPTVRRVAVLTSCVHMWPCVAIASCLKHHHDTTVALTSCCSVQCRRRHGEICELGYGLAADNRCTCRRCQHQRCQQLQIPDHGLRTARQLHNQFVQAAQWSFSEPSRGIKLARGHCIRFHQRQPEQRSGQSAVVYATVHSSCGR